MDDQLQYDPSEDMGNVIGGARSGRLMGATEWALSQMNSQINSLHPQPESLRLRYLREKQRAEAEVARLSELLDLLERNPETERIMELLTRNIR